MIHSFTSPSGMSVTPHHLASQSALSVLREGGNAIEAMVAGAATIAVAYPHANSLGGDGFWLIVPPHGGAPVAIDASGAAGSLATLDYYVGNNSIPYRGPKAALTVAGAVGGWQEALNYSDELGGPQTLPLRRLLADAIRYAAGGVPVTTSQEEATEKLSSYFSSLPEKELGHFEPFFSTFMPRGKIPQTGQRFCQPQLAATLVKLSEEGLDSFYRGQLADSMAADMAKLGMPITAQDLADFHPSRRTPLVLQHQKGEVYNLPPPTQGLASLAILGITDRLPLASLQNEGSTIHAVVEATKLAFELRDRYITDPRRMTQDPQKLLDPKHLDALAKRIDHERSAEWVAGKGPGDTVWMGVMDSDGLSVSYIQSIYHDFGSGVILPESGVLWHNRGVSFSLDPDHLLVLEPGKQPFHTLNPAATRLHDGRTMVYGTMGGDGQPQTQAAIFIRHAVQGVPLQQAVSAPRWLLGRFLGDSSDTLKLEGRFDADTVEYLRRRGHVVELLPDFSDSVGHAGAIVRHADGMLEGAFDPRSNGSAAGY